MNLDRKINMTKKNLIEMKNQLNKIKNKSENLIFIN